MNLLNRACFLVFLSLTFLAAAPAFAAKGKGLSSPLGEIKWGDKRGEVVKKVKKQMLDQLREQDDLKQDRVKMHRAKKRVIDQIERFNKSYELLGNDTNYRVSVISDEFIKGNGEAVMRIKDKVANRYYFFVDDRLYKMVVAYNQEYLKDIDFDTFVVQTAKKYGEPTDTLYGTVDGEEALTKAVWDDGNHLLTVTNKREFFGTFTMSFAEKSTAKRLSKKRLAMEGDNNSDGVSSQVKALTAESRGDVDADIVDSIVGDSEINLNEGRPVDEQVRHGQDGSDAVAAKDTSTKSKKKKTRKKKRKKRKKKKRDFSDIEASSGGDDLIIY